MEEKNRSSDTTECHRALLPELNVETTRSYPREDRRGTARPPPSSLCRPVRTGRRALWELGTRLGEARWVRVGSEASMAGFHLGAATSLLCALVLTSVRLGNRTLSPIGSSEGLKTRMHLEKRLGRGEDTLFTGWGYRVWSLSAYGLEQGAVTK